MKKMIMAVAALLISTAVFAQKPQPVNKVKDMRVERHDIRKLHHDKTARNYAFKNHHKMAAHHFAKHVRADRKHLRKNSKALRHAGLRHPAKKAGRQVAYVNHHIKKAH